MQTLPPAESEPAMTTTALSLDEIYDIANTALLSAGANEKKNADAVAQTVTRAERDGSHSHGLFASQAMSPP